MESKSESPPLEPLCVSVKEARRLTSFGQTYIFEKLKSGELASVKEGRRRLVNYQSLKKLAGVV
jgi:excisionase family DNA binding protein